MLTTPGFFRLPALSTADSGGKLFGRRKELVKIVKLLNEYRLGPSQCLIIRGNPGVGKSSLVNKLKTYFGCPLFVAEGRCTREDKAPYHSISTAFRTGWKKQSPHIPDAQKQIWKNRITFQF